MGKFEIDITGVIDNMVFDEEKVKQYGGDYQKIATDLLRDNARISLEKVSLEQKNNNLQSKIDKAIEYCEEVIKEHNNGEYNVSTAELAIKEHKENIRNVLDILKEDK